VNKLGFYISILSLISFSFLTNTCSNRNENVVRFGIFTDGHYCQCDTRGDRYYEKTTEKLAYSISKFNELNLDFVVNLGDIIDTDYHSFGPVVSLLEDNSSSVYHVLGNADYNFNDSSKQKTLIKLGMKEGYYDFFVENWQFIVLNGNDLSLHAVSENNEARYNEVVNLYNEISSSGSIQAEKWNGGIGLDQLNWLRNKLKFAEDNNFNVVIFCHFPVLPLTRHCLWNSDELVELIDKFPCVKAYFNGHNHAGNYTNSKGVHYLTLKAMVTSANENEFAVVSIDNEVIKMDGYGREIDRELYFD